MTSEDYMGMVEECQAPKVNVNGQKLTYVPLTSRSSDDQIKALKEVRGLRPIPAHSEMETWKVGWHLC